MQITGNRTRFTGAFEKLCPEFPLIPASICEEAEVFYALMKKDREKKLIVASNRDTGLPGGFSGVRRENDDIQCLICELNHDNAKALRSAVPFTKPVTIGNVNSFGFGDRLGNAGPAHLRALLTGNSGFMPVVAQQSIRELDRTNRTPEEVMDAATWAVLGEGYTGGYGADADHLKTTGDIDRMVAAGYTMFTFDPGDHVNNDSVTMEPPELSQTFEQLPWAELETTTEAFLKRYREKTLKTGDGTVTLRPDKIDLLRAGVKYGQVIAYTLRMYRHLVQVSTSRDFEVELSVDETPYPTTPVEHLVIASELQRMEVPLVSLAPRFSGEFEKGVDFKGDPESFFREYRLHQAIATEYGGYKLSIHSGSDKFTVYREIGKSESGKVHVKTAGTSYLEALRTLAKCDSGLFREILIFSLDCFAEDRKSYHISADPQRLSGPETIPDEQLPRLLDDDNTRQIFHVTFGSVLTHEGEDGRPGFHRRMLDVLAEYETVYFDNLFRHFRKHLEPFEYKE